MNADGLLAAAGAFLLLWLFVDVCVSLYAAWIFYRLRAVQKAVLRELLRAARARRGVEKNRSDSGL